MKKLGLEQGTRYAIATTIATALVLAWGWRETRSAFLEVFPFKSFGMASLIPIALLLIGVVLITIELNVVTWRFLPPNPAFSEAMKLFKRSPIRAALIAPVTEELLFRGLILSGFLKRYSPKKAIFASALLFAIWHLNPWQFVGALVAGLLFGWWRAATKSLWPGLIAHISVNSFPILSSKLTGPHQTPSTLSLGQQAIIVGLGSVLMGAGFVILRARWKTPRPRRRQPSA